MRRIASTIALLALMADGPIRGFDPVGADIIGLRLGMTETEIDARLTHQGFKFTRTADAIDTRTLDGRLHIGMSNTRGATQIVYVFDYGGKIVSAKLLDSILTRFGDPVQAEPMTWCLVAAGQGPTCPDFKASLTFLPGQLTLMLRAAADEP